MSVARGIIYSLCPRFDSQLGPASYWSMPAVLLIGTSTQLLVDKSAFDWSKKNGGLSQKDGDVKQLIPGFPDVCVHCLHVSMCSFATLL